MKSFDVNLNSVDGGAALLCVCVYMFYIRLCSGFVNVCSEQNQNPLLSMLTPIFECLPPPQNSGGFHFIHHITFMFITDPGVCVLGTYRLDRPSSLFYDEKTLYFQDITPIHHV